MEPLKWLTISFSLVNEPSRIRVALWRNLKKLGAVCLRQSIWLLPSTPQNCAAIRYLIKDFGKDTIEALVMESTIPNKADEEKVVSLFNAARDDEYLELIEKCDILLQELIDEINTEKFSFAEIEESEEELQKLNQWMKKITNRDVFTAEKKSVAESRLLDCQEALEKYCAHVYDRESYI